MRNYFSWIFFLVVPLAVVSPLPLQILSTESDHDSAAFDINAHDLPKHQSDPPSPPQEQVISVRITSSVAIGRGKAKTNNIADDVRRDVVTETKATLETYTENKSKTKPTEPTDLAGANQEFIKQLNSRKEARSLTNFEGIHSFVDIGTRYLNDSRDSDVESSIKSVVEFASSDDVDEDSVPLARSMPPRSQSNNYIQGATHKPLSEEGNDPHLTTASFDILHEIPKATDNYDKPSDTFASPTQSRPRTAKFYNDPSKFYNEPAKVYSQPAQVYSEPAKFYSEPAKIYSEPAKIYSEPAKIYGEPAKIYSEPAKFYSPPASLHLPANAPAEYVPWRHPAPSPAGSTAGTTNAAPVAHTTNPPTTSIAPQVLDHQPEKNYEVEERVSVLTEGRSHGVQESTTESCKHEKCKVGYVVEGRQYRKYRVEERTSDGFIVGEYGVVRNEDGALRGVRYTADGDASPRLIHDALIKFLQLK